MLRLLTVLAAARSPSAVGTVFESPLCRCAEDSSNLPPNSTALSDAFDVKSYGIGCQAHDEGDDATHCGPAEDECRNRFPIPRWCEQLNATDWCGASWCYVLPGECELAFRHSSLFPGRQYSYAACGGLDKISTTESVSGLAGRMLRVQLLHNSGGWKGSYNPEGHNARNHLWTGPVIEFVRSVAEQAGFQMNITDLPAEVKSNADSYSAFTRCSFAAGLGYIDLCVGNAFVLSDRVLMTPFFILENEPIHMVVGKEFWGYETISFGAPFTHIVWLAFFGLLIFITILFAVQEADKEGSMIRAPLSASESANKRFAFAIAETAYFSVRSVFTGSSIEVIPVTWGGRLVSLGFGVFVLLSLIYYEAAMTAQLVERGVAARLNTLEEASGLSLSVCIDRRSLSVIRSLHPSVSFASDPQDGKLGFIKRRDVMPGLVNHLCGVAVMPKEDLDYFHAKGQYCDYITVGEEPIFSVAKGMPLHTMHARTLGYQLQLAKNEGLWQQAKDRYNPGGSSTCESRKFDTLSTIDIEEFAYIAYLALGFTLSGGAISLVYHLLNVRRARAGLSELGRAVDHADVAGSIGLDAEQTDEHSRLSRVSYASEMLAGSTGIGTHGRSDTIEASSRATSFEMHATRCSNARPRASTCRDRVAPPRHRSTVLSRLQETSNSFDSDHI